MKQLKQYFKDEKLNQIWNICRELDKEFFVSQIERPFFYRQQHSFVELAKDASFTDNFKTDRHVSGNNRILFCKPSEVKMYILDPLHEIEAMLCVSLLDEGGLFMHYKCGSALTTVKYKASTKNGTIKLVRSSSQGAIAKTCVELAEIPSPNSSDVTGALYSSLAPNEELPSTY